MSGADLIALVPLGIVAVLLVVVLYSRPLWLAFGYLVAVPVLPPLPFGSMELSALDLLTIPALLYLLFRKRNGSLLLSNSLSLGFFLFALAAVLSVVSYTFQHGALSLPIVMRLVRLFEMLIGLLALSRIVSEKVLTREAAVKLFLLGGAIAAGVGIAMYLGGFTLRESQTFTSEIGSLLRAAGTHGDSGSFGNLMGLTVIVAVWVLVHGGTALLTKTTKVLAWVAGALGAIGLVVSLSRGGLLLASLGVAVLLVPLLLKPGRLIKTLAVGFLIVVAALAVFSGILEDEMFQLAYDAYQNRIEGLADLPSDFNRISSSRGEVWEASWNLFSREIAHWPFGLGYKSLKLHYNMLADNNFAQALFEMGIVGLSALLLLLGLALWQAVRMLKWMPVVAVLVLAIWIGVISNMVSADVLTYWHTIPALFGLLVALQFRTDS